MLPASVGLWGLGCIQFRPLPDRNLSNNDQPGRNRCWQHPRRNDGFGADMALNELRLTLQDGTPVLIRRLVAEDAALYPDFLGDVTAEDLRPRFFAPMREVNHALLDKLIHYDPARAMAFIAVDEQSRKMQGVGAAPGADRHHLDAPRSVFRAIVGRALRLRPDERVRLR